MEKNISSILRHNSKLRQADSHKSVKKLFLSSEQRACISPFHMAWRQRRPGTGAVRRSVILRTWWPTMNAAALIHAATSIELIPSKITIVWNARKDKGRRTTGNTLLCIFILTQGPVRMLSYPMYFCPSREERSKRGKARMLYESLAISPIPWRIAQRNVTFCPSPAEFLSDGWKILREEKPSLLPCQEHVKDIHQYNGTSDRISVHFGVTWKMNKHEWSYFTKSRRRNTFNPDEQGTSIWHLSNRNSSFRCCWGWIEANSETTLLPQQSYWAAHINRIRNLENEPLDIVVAFIMSFLWFYFLF